MKKSINIILFVLLSFSLASQNWIDNLPQKKNSELSLSDYQKAFNDYWNGKEIINGKYIDNKGVERKAYGWKQFKRWEYFWQDRVDRNNKSFPKAKMHNSFIEYEKNKTKALDAPWISLGPGSSRGGYAGIGRINVIAFHPSDLNTFWIGAPAGGLWKTTDGGSNWTVLTDENEVLGVSAVVVPSDYSVSETIYIGTGDRDAFDNYGVGVLKSTDGGSTWNTTGLNFSTSSAEIVNKLLLDPSDNDLLYAATTDGFYKSSNAGADWNKTTNNSFIDMEFHPGSSSVIYACSKYGKLYKSTDSGESWSTILSSVSGRRLEIAVSPDSPNIIYVIAVNTNNGLEGIYKSENSGLDFSLAFEGSEDGGALLNWSTNGNEDNDGQGWYDLSLAVHPFNSDIVYVGGINTWKSVNGGSDFSQVNHWYGGGGSPAVHADKHYMVFHPVSGDLFECNDGGIYRSSDGSVWYDLTNDLVISQMYGLGTAQSVNNITITGLQDNGTKLNYSSIWSDVMGGDGMKCLIDHSDVAVQYGSYYYGDIMRTDDFWNSSTGISENIPGGADGYWVTPFIIDPNNSNVIYIAYRSRLWKSNDKGESFQTGADIGGIKAIDISDSNSNIICVSNYDDFYISHSGGKQWDRKTSGLPINNAVITDIAIKHDDYATIWVSFSGYNSHGVYMSDDGGNSWENISEGLPQIPVNTIIQNKYEKGEDQLFAGTDYGVYIKNGSSDWVLYGTDFPKVVVTELDIYYDDETPENSRLRASTYGRGLWEVPLHLSENYVPDVSTLEKTNITITGLDIIGSVNHTYNETVTENGVVISENPNPVIDDPSAIKFLSDPVVSDGTFTLYVSGLEEGKNYYVRAFASNINGTGYGDELSFIFGVEQYSEEDYTNIEFYPNPCNGNLTIHADERKVKDISIVDFLGKEVFSASFNNGTYDLSFLRRGLYFINFYNSNEIITKKLIIK